jgi:RimJ/RimL family protein N-acetyltransferase
MTIQIKFDVFIEGNKVDLVVLNEEVIEKTNWYNWFNDEDTMKNMQKHYFPNTKSTQLDFYKNEVKGNNKKLQLGIVQKENGLFCGVISLNDIDYLNRCCELSAVIGEKQARSIEIFIESTKLIIKHAFDTLNMNRIYSGTIAKEIDELFCRALGFKHEGIFKQSVYKNGKYHDVYRHALIKKDYKAQR